MDLNTIDMKFSNTQKYSPLFQYRVDILHQPTDQNLIGFLIV